MRRRSNLDFEKRRRSRKTGYRRRKAKKKGFGNLPKPKKKIHLNLEMIASTFTWIFKIVVTCLVAFVAVWYWGQRVSTVGDSMSPVLKNADVVLVNRIVYNASSPKRGDVIVFKPKGNENSHYYTKNRNLARRLQNGSVSEYGRSLLGRFGLPRKSRFKTRTRLGSGFDVQP